jgi:CHAT domain-containing protein
VHPERTAVLLAPGAEGTDDGFLQVREIVELPLSGQVVLLSACRTAAGSVVPGEGALGLAHAFFRAGARTVVATLWTVRDTDAGAAFSLIADALGRGDSVAAAVATARRELVRQGAPAAAWAGLVVMGDGAHVPFPGGRGFEPTWWSAASAMCALFAALAWVTRRRHARARIRVAADSAVHEHPQSL